MRDGAFAIDTGSVAETKAAAEALARLLQPGDVVLLSGDLGAGKTQFVQGVAAGLGAAETPTSPTFNIVCSYASGRLVLHHFDLYRLESSEELEDVGFAEYLESGGVCFIEWAEKFPEAVTEYLAVSLAKLDESARRISARARGARFEQLLAAWARALGASAVPGALRAEVQCGAVARPAAPPRRAADADRASDEVPSSRCAQGAGPLVLSFDTANEVVAIGIGELHSASREVSALATREIMAHRASNTQLLVRIDELMSELGAGRERIACVCVGRGPGSFTGVRIAMATAKGIASALGVGLACVSSLDAVAWNAWAHGLRGRALVVADAMRKEVYPAYYDVTDGGAKRLSADRVVKADAFAEELGVRKAPLGGDGDRLTILGDALAKYRDLFAEAGTVADETLWAVSGRGLLLALQAAWKAGEADPLDPVRHDPARALPVYTRLSDAEENERARLARNDEKNLVAGVQDVHPAPDGGKGRATMHLSSQLVAPAGADGVSYHPLDARHARDVAALEALAMGTDAWSERLVADELVHKDRSWWVAELDGRVVGYAGGMVVDGDLQILKVAVDPCARRRGIARALLARMADDARNLGATSCSLEVRAGNEGAQAFYESCGLAAVGVRPRYYSDREDALIMKGPLPVAPHDVAGMELKHLDRPANAQAHRVDMGTAKALAVGGAQNTPEGPSAPRVSDAPTGFQDTDVPASWTGRQGAGIPGSEAAGWPMAQEAFGAHRPLILAIESSCDETAAAVVDGEGTLLSDVVASQIDFHARFGGVVPEIASRKHIEAICGVCAEALSSCAPSGTGDADSPDFSRAPGGTDALGVPRQGLSWRDLDAVAATYAPGLVGALVVGVAFAKGAAWALDVPYIGVNHLEGHLYANKIGCSDFAPPAVVSLVSGGNTMLVHMRGWNDYAVLGETIDDAVGEAFDKVAKALGLGYPGGPVISKLAAQGDPAAIDFPRAMMHSHDLRFSLSGLKTAVVNYINKERQASRELDLANIAASFQQAVIDVQVAKARTALEQTGAPTFCLGGGVAANPALRRAYEKLCSTMGVRLVMPPLSSCGDNAGMIALVALDRYSQGKFFDLSSDAYAHAALDQPY